MKRLKRFLTHPILAHGVFWSWNAIYIILLMFLELEEGVVIGIIKDGITGYTSTSFVIYALAAVFMPIVSIILAINKFVTSPSKLLKLFYGIELPITFLFMARLIFLREFTSGSLHIFLVLLIGMLVFFIDFVQPQWIKKKILHKIRLYGLPFTLLIGTYFFIVLIFFAVPVFGELFQGFIEMHWLEIFENGGWFSLFAIFFIYTATLFVALPIALLILYLRTPIRFYKRQESKQALYMLVAIAILNVLIFILLNSNQAQKDALAFFEKEHFTKEDKAYLISHESALKKGLLNAYLSSYRYTSTKKSSNAVREMYKRTFKMSRESAQPIQICFNEIISPFLYDGNFRMDADKAYKHYTKYFDEDIQKAHSKEIIRAMSCNWETDDIEAGILNINEKKVAIIEQNITVRQQEDIADIEIHEVYQNQTFSRQEIFYYFSLPENSVITGLWLSDDDDTPKKYWFNVSPRGAAQQVYREEVRRRVDPSLLEQVGPNKYRLRAFPINPKRKDWSKEKRGQIIEGERFHLWLSYQTLVSDKGIEMPTLTEKRNVYWNRKTKVTLNGEKAKRKNDEWLPRYNTRISKLKKNSYTHAINDSITIQVEPFTREQKVNLQSVKPLLIVDASFSMLKRSQTIYKSIEELIELGVPKENIAVIFSTKPNNITPVKEALKQVRDENTYWASTTLLDILNENKESLQGYSMYVLLTDDGFYEGSNDTLKAVTTDAPLYIHHLEKTSPIYQDALIESVQNTQGTFVESNNQLLAHYAFQEQKQEHPHYWDYQDGRLYTITQQGKTRTPASKVLASNYINNVHIEETERMKTLDLLHKHSLKEGIVTPFSSMIVLVNDDQLARLKELEQADDRFDREAESGHENITKPNDMFNVTGTPEPHEWALIFVVCAFLGFHYWRRKKLVSE